MKIRYTHVTMIEEDNTDNWSEYCKDITGTGE